MDISEALRITGFVVCEFKSDGDEICSTCGKKIKEGQDVYYERTCYEVDEGEYYCESFRKAYEDELYDLLPDE